VPASFENATGSTSWRLAWQFAFNPSLAFALPHAESLTRDYLEGPANEAGWRWSKAGRTGEPFMPPRS
jgi:hypothetical protein